jgi:hypothetical protein
MRKETLTAERLREVVSYDPVTGSWTWLEKVSTKVVVGAPAGSLKPNRYWALGLFGERYACHRLAYLYMTGEWPARDIDHVNGNPSDNRWENLRECSHAENHQNRNARTAHPGVGWHKLRGRWRASIGVGGKQVHLGLFDRVEDAIAAREAAKRTLHTFNPEQRTSALHIH